jgi:hypothetical protein
MQIQDAPLKILARRHPNFMFTLRTTLCVLLCALPMFGQVPPVSMSAPAYQLGQGTTFDMSRGVLRVPANTTGLYTLPSSCSAGQVQVTLTGFFFCGTAGWIQLPGATAGKLSPSVIPTLDQLPGVLTNQQIPTSLTASTSGNAATATALAAVPTQASTGRYCTGIAANGNCNAAQVAWGQIGGIPALLLASARGQAAGVAALDDAGKIPVTQIPLIPYSTGISGLPALGSAASHPYTDFIPSSTVIPTDLSQLANSPGFVRAASLAPVATSGLYGSLLGLPVLGSASQHAAGDFVSTTLLNAASGVPTLDASALLPVSIIPNLPISKIPALGTAATHPYTDFLLATQRGVAGGVATLDGGGTLTPAQIPIIPYTKLTGVPAYVLQSQIGQANGVPSLGNDGKIPAVQLPTSALATKLAAGAVQVGSGLNVAAGVVSVDTTLLDAAGAAATAQANSLQKALDLSDLNNPANARLHLGLGSAAVLTAAQLVASPGTNGVAYQTAPGVSRLLVGSDLISILGYTPVDSTTRNTNNGFAGLDNTGKILLANLPSIPWSQVTQTPAFVLQSSIGAVNGIAGLDNGGRVPVSQLPVPLIASTSALGSVRIPSASAITVSGAGDLTIKANTFDAYGAAGAAVGNIPVSASGQSAPSLLAPADRVLFAAKQDALGFTPQNVAQKGQANGYPSLDGLAKIPVSQLPTATSVATGAAKPGANMTVSADGSLNVAAPYALPAASISAIGGVRAFTPIANNFLTGISTTGVPLYARPAIADIQGLGTIVTHPDTDYIRTSVIGQANGVPSLSSVGLIPKAQLPLNGPQFVFVNGSQMVVRSKLNFVGAGATTINGTDNGTDTTTIQINSTGGSGSGAAYNAGTGLVLTGTTFSLPSLLTASAGCGDATHVCRFSYDAQGRVTGTTSVSISGAAGGGVTSGTLVPGNIVVATGPGAVGDSGLVAPASAPVGVSDPQILTNKQIVSTQLTGLIPAARFPAFSGDVVSTAGTAVINLANVYTGPGTCGDATHVSQNTIDVKGRVIGCTPVAITQSASSTPTSYPFTASSSVVITHNLGTKNVSLTCFDGADHWMEPGAWTATDINTITTTFASPRTGRCVPIAGIGPQGVQGPAGAGSLGVMVSGGTATGANTLDLLAGTGIGLAVSTVSGISHVTITNTAGGSSSGSNATSLNGTSIVGFNGLPYFASGTPGAATASQIGSLWSGSSTPCYLRKDGACDSGSAASANQTVYVNGAALTQRGKLAFTASGAATITGADNGSDTTTINISATGGSGTGGGVSKGNLGSIPGTCAPGDLYFAYDAGYGRGLYYCQTSNVWAAYSQIGGSGALAFDGTTGQLDVTSLVVQTSNNNTMTGLNTFTGPFVLAQTATQGLCTSGRRGEFFYINGGAGADHVEACANTASGMSWVRLF